MSRPRNIQRYQRHAEGEHPKPQKRQNAEYAADHEQHAQHRANAQRHAVVSPSEQAIGNASHPLGKGTALGLGGDGGYTMIGRSSGAS